MRNEKELYARTSEIIEGESIPLPVKKRRVTWWWAGRTQLEWIKTSHCNISRRQSRSTTTRTHFRRKMLLHSPHASEAHTCAGANEPLVFQGRLHTSRHNSSKLKMDLTPPCNRQGSASQKRIYINWKKAVHISCQFILVYLTSGLGICWLQIR
jgi:hypothetical protein